MDTSDITTIDSYIAQFPPDIQTILKQVRAVIKNAAPEAREKISWRMPTFYFNGNLVHFAAHKKHLGFYPGAEGMEAFAEKLKDYKTSKGAAQFPYDKPLPLELIDEIVRFRVAQDSK